MSNKKVGIGGALLLFPFMFMSEFLSMPTSTHTIKRGRRKKKNSFSKIWR